MAGKHDDAKYAATVAYLRKTGGASTRDCVAALGYDPDSIRKYAAMAGISHMLLCRRYRPGDKIGLLTLVAPMAERKHGRMTWRCTCDCGHEVVRTTYYFNDNNRGKVKASCGCATRTTGAAHPAWRGGRIVTKYGYVKLRAPDHPRNSNGYVPEHVLVMETRLGRYLTKSETVHHINGVRDDNRDCNLELWQKRHGAGQRVNDQTAWAVAHLKLYAPQYLAREVIND